MLAALKLWMRAWGLHFRSTIGHSAGPHRADPPVRGRVEHAEYAVYHSVACGPRFGSFDIQVVGGDSMAVSSMSRELRVFGTSSLHQYHHSFAATGGPSKHAPDRAWPP